MVFLQCAAAGASSADRSGQTPSHSSGSHTDRAFLLLWIRGIVWLKSKVTTLKFRMVGMATIITIYILNRISYVAASLTCVCPLVSLERLLSGKHSVADVTADAAGRGLPLAYELPDCVRPWPASTDTILPAETHWIITLTKWTPFSVISNHKSVQKKINKHNDYISFISFLFIKLLHIS